MKKKEPGKQNRALSDYSQKRQSRIRELIKETLEETKKQQQDLSQEDLSQQDLDQIPVDSCQDQSQVEIECIE